jgi:hypothetical protein
VATASAASALASEAFWQLHLQASGIPCSITIPSEALLKQLPAPHSQSGSTGSTLSFSVGPEYIPALSQGQLGAISRALAWEPPPRNKTPFRFAMTQEAAAHNFRVLRDASFDLHSLLMSNTGCVTHPGDEFRPVSLLDPIFKRHPLWQRVRQMLTVGAKFPLEPLDDEARLRDLAAAHERGNHGGATRKPTALDTFFRDEVKKGWMLPLPLSKLDQIPNLCLSPVNIVEQGTIDMHGNRVKSERLTHDLSFDFGSGKPVNARAIDEQLTPCFYGHALRRFCHYIVALRQQHPNIRIFLAKFDWKSAYRRLHFHSTTAPQCTMMLPPIAYMAL